MEGVWVILLAFAAGMSLVWWGLLVWAVLVLRSRRRRGTETDKTQAEALGWLVSLGLGFTGLAVAVWWFGAWDSP